MKRTSRTITAALAASVVMSMLAAGALANTRAAAGHAAEADLCDITVASPAWVGSTIASLTSEDVGNPVSAGCTADVTRTGAPGGAQFGAGADAVVGAYVCVAGACQEIQDQTVGTTGAGASRPPASAGPTPNKAPLPPLTIVEEGTVCLGNICNEAVTTEDVSAPGLRVAAGDETPVAVVGVNGSNVLVRTVPVCLAVNAERCQASTSAGNDRASVAADPSRVVEVG